MIADYISPSLHELGDSTIDGQDTQPMLDRIHGPQESSAANARTPTLLSQDLTLSVRLGVLSDTDNRGGIRKTSVFRGHWDSLFPFGRRVVLGELMPDQSAVIDPKTPAFKTPSRQPATGQQKRIDPGDDFVLRLYLRDLETNSQASDHQASEAGPVIFDDLARERLVIASLTRVIRIAFDYQGQGLSIGDLVNEGNLGLMRAAELFDPTREVSFSHYSKSWIRMHMKRALSYQALPVNLPADFSWRRGQVLGAVERLTSDLKRSPDDTELSEACGLELSAVRRIRSSSPPTFVTFETPASSQDSNLTLAEILPDPAAPCPVDEAIRHSDREFLERLLAHLTSAQQKVIRLRFGLDDGCGRTLEEVAQLLGYVRQGIHRIETAALFKLRQHARFDQMKNLPGMARPEHLPALG